jgi:hypothetical protein
MKSGDPEKSRGEFRSHKARKLDWIFTVLAGIDHT